MSLIGQHWAKNGIPVTKTQLYIAFPTVTSFITSDSVYLLILRAKIRHWACRDKLIMIVLGD